MKKLHKIKTSEQESEIRYANWIKAVIDLIKPKNLILIAGRGTAKSTDIIAERSIDVCYDMPRGPFAFVADSYVNLMTNIVPGVLLGWERKKWFEYNKELSHGHYVVDKPPPDHWPSPYIKTFNYKHTISTFLGNKFFLLSLDRASISAGISVVHHFSDETKFQREDRMSKLFPTLRGDSVLYGNSHYFMGQTFCSDMPNPNLGEYDWMLRLEKNMNKEQIVKIIQTALVVNELNIKLLNARKNEFVSAKQIRNLERQLETWTKRLNKIRQGSTFFYVVSSFANADILTMNYFKNLIETLEFEEFKSSVLSIKATLEKGARFYANLNPRHFYYDGYNYKYYDQFGLLDNITQTSEGLKYIKHNQILEAGFDAGNMMSLVFGQDQGNVYRVIKGMYVLTPEWIRELANKFIDFFRPHQAKTLHLYFDRSANQYSKAKRDFATKLKKNIEFDASNKATGWHVVLMSVGQGNITHSEEFDLMTELMSGRNRHLPELQIDAHECRDLKSSLELAPLIKDSRGNIKKDKSSEKLASHRLPSESTNFSDAFKYLLCRKKYLKIVKHRRLTSSHIGEVKVRG
jgi:hypothetical protein